MEGANKATPMEVVEYKPLTVRQDLAYKTEQAQKALDSIATARARAETLGLLDILMDEIRGIVYPVHPF